MKIRKFKLKDAPQIKKVVEKSLYRIFKVKPTDLKDLDNIKKNYIIFYVAEDKRKIVGCIALKIFRGNPLLKRMYILKNYRNKSLGQKLLDKIIKYCKDEEYKKIALSTTPQMKDAMNFYEKNGFRKTRTNKKKQIFFEKSLK